MAATIASLLTDVYEITKRPDKSSLTTLAIKHATLKTHRFADFSRDILRQVVAVSPDSDFRYTIDLTAYPQFRRFISLVEFQASGVSSIDFEFLKSENIFRDYRVEKQDYAYILGTDLILRASKAVTSLELTYYAHPIVTDVGYSSWIADSYPDIIVAAAVAEVFDAVGKDAEAKRFRVIALQGIQDLLKDE